MPSHSANGSWFNRFSKWTSVHAGRPSTFVVAIVIISLWALSGPWFGFGDTWQLLINTGTTVITFLMVFLIQGTQNRESQAVQAKLDELIFSTKTARNDLLDLEDLDDEELSKVHERYVTLAGEARSHLEARAEKKPDL